MKISKIFLLYLIFTNILFAAEEIVDKNLWKVYFEGNSLYSNSQLTSQLDLPTEFGLLDTSRQDFLMHLAKGNLELLYFSEGYFSAEIFLKTDSEKTDSDTSYTRNYSFNIKEGPHYRFSSVKISFPEENAPNLVTVENLRISDNRYYKPTLVSEDIQDIQKNYRKAGYLHNRIDYIERIDTVKYVVHVEIFIDPAAQVRMGDFKSKSLRPVQFKDENGNRMEGLSDTSWLNKLWKIPHGEIIDGNQYAVFRSKLFSTQLFTQARLEDSLRADGFSDIHFNVVERTPGEALFSAFYEEIYGFGAAASTKHRNFLGRFHEASAGAVVAQNKQEISLGYANPLLFGTAFSFIPSAIRFDNRVTFNHERTSPPAYPDSLEERFELINRGDITFNLSQKIRYRSTLDGRLVKKNEERMIKIKFETSLHFDFTDNYFNPTKGIRFVPTAGVGTNFTGKFRELKGNPYSYGELTVSGYLPLFGPFLGALSASYGKFFDEASEDDARVFYQGGSRSVRGYRFHSIFPGYETEEDGETVTYTGLTPQYLRLNQELRFNIPSERLKNWQLVQFYDWTYVSDADEIFDTKQKASLGLGIRYRWQFLTLRLDYAFKKDFDNWNAESFRFNRIAFDLSQAF